MTRFEKIKAMTVEELAEHLDNADADDGFLTLSCRECPDRKIKKNGDIECDGEHCHKATLAYLRKEIKG